MRSLNKISLIGNVGQDPKVIPTQNGGEMATFSLATTRQWKDNSGELQKETQWHRLVVFDKLVKVVADYVKKGSPLFVEGEMRYGEYQNGEGVIVKTADIRVRDLVLLGSKKDAPASQEESDEIPF